MRQLLSSVVIGVVAAVAAAGCGRPAAATDRPVPRGDFRVLMPAAPGSLNPNLGLDESAYLIGRSLFNHLISVNERGRLLPELAESWTTSEDGRTYRFTLRRGVRWHDGAPFSSADVRWSLEMIAKDGYAREVLAPVERIETPDANTVVIHLRHPWAPFAADLASYGVSILPRHIYEGRDWRSHPANLRPIGTGPFKFSRWDGNVVVLEANPEYFRSGPYVARIVFRAVPPEAIGDMLIRGEADYSVTRPAVLDVADASGGPIAVHALPTAARYYMAMNLRRAPLGDVRVRRAIAAAVERGPIVQTAMGGLGAPALGWYTPDVEWAYNADARVPEHDPAAARRQLDVAGLRANRRGERFRLSLVVPESPPIRAMADLIREQLGNVGIGVTVEALPIVEWPRRVLGAHQFDLTILSGLQGPDPDALRRRFSSASVAGAYIGYSSEAFREAVDRGARAVDLAERARAYRRAQEVLAEDVPFVPLAESVKLVVHNRRVSGLPQLEARGLVGAFDFSLVKVDAVASSGR